MLNLRDKGVTTSEANPQNLGLIQALSAQEQLVVYGCDHQRVVENRAQRPGWRKEKQVSRSGSLLRKFAPISVPHLPWPPL